MFLKDLKNTDSYEFKDIESVLDNIVNKFKETWDSETIIAMSRLFNTLMDVKRREKWIEHVNKLIKQINADMNI